MLLVLLLSVLLAVVIGNCVLVSVPDLTVFRMDIVNIVKGRRLIGLGRDFARLRHRLRPVLPEYEEPPNYEEMGVTVV